MTLQNMATSRKYQFAVIATDVVVFTMRDNKLQVLLMKMTKEPYANSWAAPGGLVGASESPETAARRLLKEKTCLANVYLEQLATFGEVDRDPFGRVVSVAYLGLLPTGAAGAATVDSRSDAAWYPTSKLPKLAYDHSTMISVAVERLQNKLGYTTVAGQLLPKEFTLSELQSVYEIILGRAMDKRNFRKKFLALELVQSTGRQQDGGAHRPAALYHFVGVKPQVVNIL